MMHSVFLALMLLAVFGSTQAAQFAGSWSYKTKSKPADFFSAEIFQRGYFVCGQVTATSDGTNKVDASWVAGKIVGNFAEVEFESGFNERGMRGLARIELKNGHLKWHVTRDLTPSWIWNDATLKPDAWEVRHKNVVSNWCKSNWRKIEKGATNEIDFQP